jgi:hypothetical protein
MAHTSHYSTLQKAEMDYERMKEELSRILSLIPRKDDPNVRAKVSHVRDEIWTFTEQHR